MEYIPYFRYGRAYKLVPPPPNSLYEDRGFINDAEKIVCDGKMYDLTSEESIYSIPIPDYGQIRRESIESPVLYLEYVLRMHASYLWKKKEYHLALVCLGKSTQMMPFSPIGHRKETYYRIVDWEEELGKFQKAAEWEQWIEDNAPNLEQDVFTNVLDRCRTIGSDLVYCSWSGAQSAATAKYQGRVYSISGKDKKFPALPDFMKRPQNVCYLSGPFTYWGDKSLDTIFYKGKDVNAVSVSWRPFKDDRSPQEIAGYKNSIEKIMQPLESRYRQRVYFRIKYFLPEYLPKSRSAFNRMAAENSEEYKALMQAVEASGIPLPEKPVYKEPIDPEPDYNGGHRKPLFVF